MASPAIVTTRTMRAAPWFVNYGAALMVLVVTIAGLATHTLLRPRIFAPRAAAAGESAG